MTPSPSFRRGLFLDLDGTLADSLTALRAVYYDFLARFGVAGSEAEFQSLNGPPLVRIVDILRKTHDLAPSREELLALYGDLIARSHDRVLPAPGALELLTEAGRHGWAVAVVTSTAREPAQRWLVRTGLAPLVDVIVGGDEVETGKPDPAPYRLALERTGCAASCSLAVEDSPQGATSAAAAGIPVWVLASALAPQLSGRPQILGLLPDLSALVPLTRLS
jgi:HAD superfamily hydrolase (TIGR01509 family)